MTAQSFIAAAAKGLRNIQPGRRTEQPVRRNSYDVDDRRSQVFRPIGGGTLKGALRWRDQYMRTVKEYDRESKEAGKRHPIGANAIRVLEALLYHCALDFKTGRLDPAIATIQQKTGFARKTVVDALARLKDHGFLNWVRRTERTGNPQGQGPKVKQATNAYYFDLARLKRKSTAAWRRLRQLLGQSFISMNDSPQASDNRPQRAENRPNNPDLEAALSKMEHALYLKDASSQCGQNPLSRI